MAMLKPLLLSAARQAVCRRGAQLAVRPSAARPRTSARQRTGWTWPWEQQPEAPAPADMTMVLTLLVSTLTIIGAQKILIDDWTASLSTKIDDSFALLSTKLDDSTASINEINTKLDALSMNLQAQQVQLADLKGQVTILREHVQEK